jgi:hypothetical protein
MLQNVVHPVKELCAVKTTHFAARTPHGVVYSHDTTESNDDNNSAYDIDCALDIIQANGRPPGTSIALSQWTQLSQDATFFVTPANDMAPTTSEDTSTTLLANATQHKNVSMADLCKVSCHPR